MLLDSRIALVTGASRGIGAATARLLAAQGAALAVNYHESREAAQAVVDDITSKGGRAIAVQADVRDEAQVRAMIEEASSLGPIDILVLNAAIQFPVTPFVDFAWEDFQAKLTGEISAAFFTVQAVAPSMVERGSGCIIGVSSGLSRQPGPGFSAHSTAKSGLDALMKSLALELGPHGVRVNTVAPGLTDTDATAHMPASHKEASAARTPLRRNALPDDVAEAVLLLAAAGFVSGAYVPVSGGNHMI